MSRYFQQLLILVLVIIPNFSNAADGDLPWIDENLENEIIQIMGALKAPGLAVGVIDLRNNRTYTRGFGLRNVEKVLPVTDQTVFMIGSTTKGFTATGLAILNERKRLQWNEPVRRVLPEFELKDDVATRLATPIDLESHMTGLPRHDLIWYGRNDMPRDYFLSVLRHLDPSATFRQRWQYNNTMYLVAGLMIERISGLKWEDFTRREILSPLGMTGSSFGVAEMVAATDHATPYMINGNEKLVSPPYHEVGAHGPAGSINSSVRDMLTWLKFNLKSEDTTDLVAAKSLDFLHKPVAALGARLDHPEIGHIQYAKGWMVVPYRGHNWVWHDGGIDGFTSHVGFMPDDQLGVVVFTNSDYSGVTDVVARMIYDHLLNKPKIDWLAREIKNLESAKPAGQSEQAGNPKASLPLIRPAADYDGAYEHPAYGKIEIVVTSDAENLNVLFRDSIFPLDHAGNGAFKMWGRFGTQEFVMPLTFQTDMNGRIDALILPLEPTVAPIRFGKNQSDAN